MGQVLDPTLVALVNQRAYSALQITPNATPASNAGRLHVTVHYIEITPPTS